MGAAAIIAAIMQFEPVVQNAIVALVQKYQSAGTTGVTEQQAAADLDQLDQDIADFDQA